MRIEIKTKTPVKDNIAKFGQANDKDSDSAWESYKLNAAYNLEKWDMLKTERDRIKAQA